MVKQRDGAEYSLLQAHESTIQPKLSDKISLFVSQNRLRILKSALILSVLLNTFQLFVSFGLGSKWVSRSALPTLYSPARGLLRPVIKKFSPAFESPSSEPIYIRPPSVEVDYAWRGLYETTLAISRTEAEQLPNKTIPLYSGPDAPFLTGLNVFHDLHCLDSIRKALWVGTSVATHHSSSISRTSYRRESTSKDAKMLGDPAVLAAYREEIHDPSHLMHCINGLRESIMCHSDVTPLSWQYVSGSQAVRVFSDVAHTCNDFEIVLQWARKHAYSAGIDESGWIDGRPEEVGRCGFLDEGCGWD